VDYVPVSERMYYEYADELLMHIRELVELENGVNFTGNAEIGIVLTEEELDEFIENTDAFTKCRKLYIGHDILLDAGQAQKLKDNKVSIKIIPDYYYKELEG
jgi:adenine-specific DNA-methyltransferase